MALRYCDHRVGVLASAWPTSGLALDRPDPPGEELRARARRIARAPVTVTGAEVGAVLAREAASDEQSARRMQEVIQRRALAAFGHRVAPAPAPDAQVPEAAGSSRSPGSRLR